MSRTFPVRSAFLRIPLCGAVLLGIACCLLSAQLRAESLSDMYSAYLNHEPINPNKSAKLEGKGFTMKSFSEPKASSLFNKEAVQMQNRSFPAKSALLKRSENAYGSKEFKVDSSYATKNSSMMKEAGGIDKPNGFSDKTYQTKSSKLGDKSDALSGGKKSLTSSYMDKSVYDGLKESTRKGKSVDEVQEMLKYGTVTRGQLLGSGSGSARGTAEGLAPSANWKPGATPASNPGGNPSPVLRPAETAAPAVNLRPVSE